MFAVQIITDLASVPEPALFDRLRRAADLPVFARARLEVQLRGPGVPVRDLLRLGERLRRATADLGARLIVNDRVDLAVLLAADGAHLGRASVPVARARALLGPHSWVSTSAHSVSDVLAAAAAGADAALLSPIFASPGKGAPLGPSALSEATAALRSAGRSLALYALGGVTVETAPACLSSGASGLAAIRADLLPLLESPPLLPTESG